MLASMRRRKKMRPAGITLVVNAIFPISERSSRLVHFLHSTKADSSCMRRESFSGSTRIVWAAVCSSIPRKVMHEVGSVRFINFVSIPRWSQSNFEVRSHSSCHGEHGPTLNWSVGTIYSSKNGPGQFLAAVNGPPRPIMAAINGPPLR